MAVKNLDEAEKILEKRMSELDKEEERLRKIIFENTSSVAYSIYQYRLKYNLAGDANSDWFIAKMILDEIDD